MIDKAISTTGTFMSFFNGWTNLNTVLLKALLKLANIEFFVLKLGLI